MQFPLGFYDISLLLAVTTIILLVTSEVLSPHYDKAIPIIEKGRLRSIALILFVLFLSTVVIRIYEIIITP